MCANLDAMLAGGGAAGLAALLTGLKDIRPEARVRLKVRAAAPLHPSPPHVGTSAPCHGTSAIVCACDMLATLSQAWLFELHFSFRAVAERSPVRHLSGLTCFVLASCVTIA